MSEKIIVRERVERRKKEREESHSESGLTGTPMKVEGKKNSN